MNWFAIFGGMKRQIHSLIDELLWKSHSSRLTGFEAERNFKLKSRMEKAASSSGKDTNVSGPWARNIAELRSNVRHRDARNFLQWPVVRYTMFHEPKTVELEYLRSSASWPMWRKVLEEAAFGNPKPYTAFPKSNGNVIHCAYHLARFFGNDPVSFGNSDVIMEFGGGYGSMVKLVHDLGFRGTYVIFDLPEFSALQEYYLTTLGLKVFTEPTREKGIVVISSQADLKRQCELTPAIDLFIATWSLSESPLELRKNISDILPPCSNWLVAFQERFDGIDNLAYFKDDFMTGKNIKWDMVPIDHIRGSHYLFGRIK